MSDHDFAAEQKYQLQVFIQRCMAVTVGRGMYTLNTVRPLITQAIKIPGLTLSGKGEQGATISLDETEMPADQLIWPRFHNGVAAGLRIVRPGHANLSTTWIAYHRPSDDQLNDEHAGFIMALGLLGHLRDLSPMTVFDYLSTGHETTCTGLLLGMAAAYRSTMDPVVAKMLSIHVPALLPLTSAEIDISHMVSTAAVVGVGLLYEETAHRRITEVLLAEIGRSPGPDTTDTCSREAHALGAGLALGMVVLGKGDDTPALADLQIAERLRQYMEGGAEVYQQDNAMVSACGPQAADRKDMVAHRCLSDLYYRLLVLRSPRMEQPNQKRGKSPINIDVTCPGSHLNYIQLFLLAGPQIPDHLASLASRPFEFGRH